MSYETETRAAYQNQERASAYHAQLVSGFKWARAMMWRERRLVARALRLTHLGPDEIVVDFPCGSGVMIDAIRRTGLRSLGVDISSDMIAIARHGTPSSPFVVADVCQPPFRPGRFRCVLTIGLMHRLPADVRLRALRALRDLTAEFLIVSFSVDSTAQRFKGRLVRRLGLGRAPHPAGIETLHRELRECGLQIVRTFSVLPFLSAERILLLTRVN